MALNSLADWITNLLLQPQKELNRKYVFSRNDSARTEVEALPEVESMGYGLNEVSEDLLQQLNLKIRGQRCEAAIWDAIVFYVRGPLPIPVAHDLIDRNVIVSQLGHKRQHDEVQHRLASLVDEALLTLVGDMFTTPTYNAAELQSLLGQHPVHWWLLEKWDHWAFMSSEVREREKEIVFHRWAWEHPKGTNDIYRCHLDIPSPEQYLEILAQREQEQDRIERAKEEERLQAEQAAQARRLEILSLSERVLTAEEIQQIFSSKDPDELLAVANNPHVPIAWLQKLVNCYQVKGARQIREAVQQNPQFRASKPE